MNPTTPTQVKNAPAEAALVSSEVLYNQNEVINVLQQEGVLTLTPSQLTYKSKAGDTNVTLAVGDIKSVSSNGITLRVTPNAGRSHAFEFAAVAVEYAGLASSGRSSIGTGKMLEAVEAKSDKNKWIAAFSQVGITVANRTTAQSNKLGIYIGIGVVVLIILYQAAQTLLSK